MDAGPAILALLLAHPSPLADRPPARSLLDAAEAETALRVNTFDAVRWFDRERFELAADMLAVTAGASAAADAAASETPARRRPAAAPGGIARAIAVVRRLRDAAEASGWRWDDFRTAWLAASEPKARAAAKKPPAKARAKKPAAPRRPPKRR